LQKPLCGVHLDAQFETGVGGAAEKPVLEASSGIAQHALLCSPRLTQFALRTYDAPGGDDSLRIFGPLALKQKMAINTAYLAPP
jgi:hypothetical protein